MKAALQHRQPALLVKVALGEAAQDGADHVAQLEFVFVLFWPLLWIRNRKGPNSLPNTETEYC